MHFVFLSILEQCHNFDVMNMKLQLIVLLSLLIISKVHAQQLPFTEGKYIGTMYIQKMGKTIDSFPSVLTIKTIKPDSIWQWKTEFLSPKMPVVKNYLLKIKDLSRGVYITDEGEGIELVNYLFGNKMFSQFETAGFFLTANYEWKDDEIIYELTSSSKIKRSNNDVYSYNITTLQKVIYKKEP